MDVVYAFLYRFLNKVIYIEQPHLFTTKRDKVCTLIKTLYWPKQATHIWYETFDEFLKKLRFVKLKLDHGIFISKEKQVFISSYVDDLLFFGTDIPRLENIQQKLYDQFQLTDLGDISHYLGIEVDYVVREKITFCQSNHRKKVLDLFKMTGYQPTIVLINHEVANSLFSYDGNAEKAAIKWCQSAIRSLIGPAVCSHPDITYSVGVLNHYSSNSKPTYCNLVVQVFQYFSATLGLGITFNTNSENNLVVYTNSDYAGLINGWKSTGGYIFMLSGVFLSHQSNLQNTVPL